MGFIAPGSISRVDGAARVVQGQGAAGGALARLRGEFCVQPDGAFLPAFTVLLTCCETG